MNPKEKAEDLIMKMYYAQDESLRWSDDANRCALVAVDEIINCCDFEFFHYWNDVRVEIEKS